jgi:endoglucanase
MKRCFTLLLFCVLAFESHSQSVAQSRCDNFKQGVNLSNWLEAYWQSNWPSPAGYNRQFLMDIKAAGIKSVRLPIGFASVIDTLAPYTIDTTHVLFSIVDSVISWTAELDMNLILDNHHQWPLSDTTWRNTMPRLAHLWSVLAQRYNHLDPDKYTFEILNEPAFLTNDSLNILFSTVIDTIRKYAPAHSIVVSPTLWSGGAGYLAGYLPLSDTNLIYTFHSYDPFPFTHQGFSWANPYYPPGTPYPGSGYDGLMPFAWEAAMLFKNTYHRPIFLGELGVGIHADEVSRCNWIDSVAERIDRYHTSVFHWDVLWDFRLFNSGVVSEDSVIPCFKKALHLYGDTLTSIGAVGENTELKMFPNPASTSFNCVNESNEETRIAISDACGREVYSAIFFNRHEIATDKWARGTYFVKLTTRETSFAKRILIQ